MTARLECSGPCVAGRSMRLSVLVLCLLPHFSWAVSYKQGDPVILYVNKVGPYHNPQETYHYYTLPVCRPKEVSVHGTIQCYLDILVCLLYYLMVLYMLLGLTVRLTCFQVRHKALSLGEVLDGDRMAESLYNIHFKENTERQTLCKLTLSEKEVAMQSYLQKLAKCDLVSSKMFGIEFCSCVHCSLFICAVGMGNDEQNKCNEFAIMARILHPAPALIKHG